MSPISGGARYGSGARKTGRPGSGSSGWPTTGSRNRESVIRGQRVASPLDTQGGSRMPESGPYGSVRGARGNSRPYRESEQHSAKVTRLTPTGNRRIEPGLVRSDQACSRAINPAPSPQADLNFRRIWRVGPTCDLPFIARQSGFGGIASPRSQNGWELSNGTDTD